MYNKHKILKVCLKSFYMEDCSALYLHHHIHSLWLFAKPDSLNGCCSVQSFITQPGVTNCDNERGILANNQVCP
jgi:hypothetical protein